MYLCVNYFIFIRMDLMPENSYKYFISLESLGGGQRDTMTNCIFKIPDFCLKPLSPVTIVLFNTNPQSAFKVILRRS